MSGELNFGVLPLMPLVIDLSNMHRKTSMIISSIVLKKILALIFLIFGWVVLVNFDVDFNQRAVNV